MIKYRTIKTLNSRIDAAIAKSYLENEGIESKISSDDAGQSIPSLQTTKGVKLLTSIRNFKKACELLDKK